MFRRLLGSLLAVAGIALVCAGWLHCARRASAARVAEGFLGAVRDGDPYRARQLMLDGESRIPPEIVAGFGWERDQSGEIRVKSLVFEGDAAVAHMQVSRRGARIEPVLRLVRRGEGEWAVASIGNLTVDRRWIDRFESSSIADQDRELTELIRERVDRHSRGDLSPAPARGGG